LSMPRDLLKGWNVLVVDDEPDSLEVASIILEGHGATVRTVTNGQEALNVLKTMHPKFILSDLSMPILDGWRLLEAIKAEPTLAHIPVIALTAHAMIGDRERGMAAGFYNYLTKPLIPATFMKNLVRLLREAPDFEILREIVLD
jgi:two-component system, cell cycle response regulator DivK